MVNFAKPTIRKQTVVKDAEFTSKTVKEEQNHPSFQKRLRKYEADEVLKYVSEIKNYKMVSNNID